MHGAVRFAVQLWLCMCTKQIKSIQNRKKRIYKVRVKHHWSISCLVRKQNNVLEANIKIQQDM
jgi:hypothetical protein